MLSFVLASLMWTFLTYVVNVRRAVYQMQAADFLRELLYVRDDHLVLSNNVDFKREELHALIDYICTN